MKTGHIYYENRSYQLYNVKLGPHSWAAASDLVNQFEKDYPYIVDSTAY
jgi:hypothetical protein